MATMRNIRQSIQDLNFPKMMKAAQCSDVGMWLQTIMLLLRREGLDSCPLEVLGMYGRTIKDQLGFSDDTLLFCGLSIGRRDTGARQPTNLNAEMTSMAILE
jgi:nitroreductase